MPLDSWVTVMPKVVAPFSALLFAAAFLAAQAIAHEMRRQQTSAENRMYRAVIEALPDCLNAKDTEGRFLVANPATADLMGADDAEALIGRSDFDFYPLATAREFRVPESELMAAGVPTTCEQRFGNADGGVSWLSTLKAPLRDDDGTVVGIITHNREITAQKLMEQELAQTQRRLADAIASMADGFAMFDSGGTQVFCNTHYLELFPKTSDVRSNGTGLRFIIRTAIERGEEVAVVGDIDNVIERTFAALTSKGDRQMRLADGRWINARTRQTEEGGCLIVYSDVTAAKDADAHLRSLNQRLEAMALHDGLTGLLNRRAFDIELDAAVARARGGGETFSLLMIDVDHFKAFNDTYGHPAGDDCLRAIGNRVRTALRSYFGAQVARYGGEEIAAILPHAREGEANAVASLVVSAVRALGLAHVGSDRAIVTVSIGVAVWHHGVMTSSADVLVAADKGLYSAKAAGRDCVKAIETGMSLARNS